VLGAPSFARAETEVRKIRLVHAPAMCLAPQYLAEDLLRAEGFAEIEYVPVSAVPGKNTIPEILAAGAAQFSMDAAPTYLLDLDAGDPLVLLAGIHSGCYELYAQDHVRSVRELKGRRIAVSAFESAHMGARLASNHEASSSSCSRPLASATKISYFSSCDAVTV
jgi:NitT/TauT family transport system substrate-binding protein